MAYVDFIPEQRLSRFPFPGTTYRTDFVKPQTQGMAPMPPIALPGQTTAPMLGPTTHLPPGPPPPATGGTVIQIRPTYCPRCFTQYNPAFSLCPTCHPPRSPMPPATVHAVPPRGVAAMNVVPNLRLAERAPGPPAPPSSALALLPPHSQSDLTDSSSTERFMMSSMLDVVNDVLQEHEADDRQNGPAPALLTALDPSPHPLHHEVESSPLCALSSTATTTTSVTTTAGLTIPASLSKVTLCSKCGQEYTAFCIECQDFLCVACVTTHEQDMLTKDHRILDTPNSSQSSSRKTTPPSAPLHSPIDLKGFDEDQLPNCDIHPDEKVAFFCHVCVVVVCKSCGLDHHSHHNCLGLKEAYAHFRPNIEELLSKTQVEINMLDLSYDAAERMTESVVQKQTEAVAGVHKIFQAHREALAQREKEVISQINTIAEFRLHSLSKGKEDISGALSDLKSLSSEAEKALQEDEKSQMLVTHFKLSEKLQNSHSYTFGRNPVEDDSFILKSNVPEAQKALKGLCKLTTAPYPPLCTAMGEGLYHPRVNRLCTVILCTKDRSGEPCLEGGERLFVQLKATAGGGGLLPVDVRDNQDGSYSINFRPRMKGEHQLVIAIRGQHIAGSPFSMLVDGGREYGRFGVVSQCWGSEGSSNGQFCRPWGICCDQQSNIIVGDRSNHRIQVFDCNGILKYKFGTEGVRPGQFNRPAGVAITREGHIVVADKDNHRIQLLKIDGTFLFMFGSKGGNDGQMIYPYDVAVNQMDGRIAVTDTGNHRLLIFSHDGILLGKFGYKGYLCGHFDSPRGIAFNDDGHIIVSDFNVHHILVIHPDGTTARILGSQGNGNGQFMRPQGIAVDHMGNFVIADTRNNRIVIMHPSGHFIAKFGTMGTAPGQFDRPTSVCVLPDGRIAVVDFGNSRVQLF